MTRTARTVGVAIGLCTLGMVSPAFAADMRAPTTPAALVNVVVGSTVGLSWELSTDNVGVAGYTVTRNGIAIGTTIDTTFSDIGLAPSTYTYTVSAFDAAGNRSAASNSVTATVLPPPVLSFNTPSLLPDATQGQPYLMYIVGERGPTSKTFALKMVGGKVPAGTKFYSNTLPSFPEGKVLGTPTKIGTSTFTVELKDDTGASVRRTFSLTVVAPPPLSMVGGVPVLNAGVVGQPFTARVTDSAGASATGQHSITVSS